MKKNGFVNVLINENFDQKKITGRIRRGFGGRRKNSKYNHDS